VQEFVEFSDGRKGFEGKIQGEVDEIAWWSLTDDDLYSI
jgi:hypothetical protein